MRIRLRCALEELLGRTLKAQPLIAFQQVGVMKGGSGDKKQMLRSDAKWTDLNLIFVDRFLSRDRCPKRRSEPTWLSAI